MNPKDDLLNTKNESTSKEKNEGRDFLIKYLRKELIGPAGGLKEELEGESPQNRYTLGVLFPPDIILDKELDLEELETSGDGTIEDNSDDPVSLANQFMPSSIGVSFYFTGSPLIKILLHGARYAKTKDGKSKWFRRPIAELDSPEEIIVKYPEKGLKTKQIVLNSNAEINVHWRNLGKGFLVTVTLVNAIKRTNEEAQGEDCLCQVGFKCYLISGEIQEYPSVNAVTSDPEEQELQLLYRRNKTFAIGHGCSAEWEDGFQNPSSVKTQVLPMSFVRSMSHDLEESPDILLITNLADQSIGSDHTINELSLFVDIYENWINNLENLHQDIPRRLIEAKSRIREKLEITLRRMRNGIAYLSDHKETALLSFRLANLAMLMQMRHSKEDLGGKRKEANHANTDAIDYLELKYKWRPFQLAFQLLALESVASDQSVHREDVDLIWFPTGGGKTEAYLALAAFEIFHRRIRHGIKGAGTVVITRYTLRLLTSQQFLRAARLITACEFIRRLEPDLLGTEEIRIGFWAGTSQHTYKKALESFVEITASSYPSQDNKFQIDNCPWCGTGLLPLHHAEDLSTFGFACDNQYFRIFCPTKSCAFHNVIPVSVVDEDLYKRPPSFLIGTVDKFARMAWIEGPGAFFGGNKFLPPSLVIQDELHLLSGPLGTTVGLYESAFEGLMTYYGAKPKIVASTATIRSAGSQVNGLFGRKTLLFPSSGYTYDDSFFAKTDYSEKGRLYAGIMSSNHRATTSVIRTSAALLQGVLEAENFTSDEKDAYWTLVMYHLSLRELGKTVSFARDDIPARIKIIAEAQDRARNVYDEDVLELTSNLAPSAIPASLARMEIKEGQNGCVSILACTNMLSVGIDISRLGLMLVNGQPKTTSEYIQASSRVGRGLVPGVVITHYSASKPRDRSHYESFQAYHSSIYKYVEPASVTPFSLPSRNRALHAALVILVRHGVGLAANDSAKSFDRNSPEVQKVVDILVEQVRIKDPQEAESTKLHLERLLQEWQDKTTSAYPLCYDGKGSKSIEALLKHFGAKGTGWPTLNSMRNVDAQCEISLE